MSSQVLSEEQLSRFTGYPVTLPVFEGPLDLLLYFIRRQEIDVHDIPIASITAQFLNYLALMEALDIEVAADFLVMASTLMEIKSRMLLPKPPAALREEEEEEDPRAELVRRLLEYQQYKSAAGELQRRASEQQRIFLRSAVVQDLPLLKPDSVLAAGQTDAFGLWAALQEVLARIETAGPVVREVVRPKLTIRQQMLHILKMLEAQPAGVSFASLFFAEGHWLPTRFDVIVTFLALLELMRLHRIAVIQRELFGEIIVRAHEGQTALPLRD